MINSFRKVLPYTSTVNKSYYFFVPEKVRPYRIKAVAWGGAGGTASTAGGGGGGAGNYIDQIYWLKPNSLVTFSTYGASANTQLQLKFRQLNALQDTLIALYKGLDGSNASGTTAGNGGDSGAGFSGGVNTAAANHPGHGTVDIDGLIHTCGGWAGNGSGYITPSGINLDFSFSSSSLTGTNIQQYKNKHTSLTANAPNMGGAGGCSYFGGSNSILITQMYDNIPGYGAGQRGQHSGELGFSQYHSDAFFEIEWEA